MTLGEFLRPVAANSNRERCLAVLYYKHRYGHVESLTAEQIKQALIHSRIPRAKFINVADVLAKSGALVDSPAATANARLWRLTDSGKEHIRSLMGLPETEPELEHDGSALNKI